MLRKKGLDAAVITTSAFQGLAKMTASALGDPEVRLVTLTHPLGGVDQVTLGERAQTAAEQIAAWLGEVAARRNT